MRIGIFGGTFDPPHLGHLILANEALQQFKLSCVLWLLTPSPPHKNLKKISSQQNRVNMVQLAIAENPGFTLSRIDIDRLTPHYALDTMVLLRQQSPTNKYYYLMGLDSLNDLPAWHKPAEFISLCERIVVMLRYGEEVELPHLFTQLPGLDSKVRFLKTPLIEISGTDIRKRARAGKPFRYFVPEQIYQYILDHHLYQG